MAGEIMAPSLSQHPPLELSMSAQHVVLIPQPPAEAAVWYTLRSWEKASHIPPLCGGQDQASQIPFWTLLMMTAYSTPNPQGANVDSAPSSALRTPLSANQCRALGGRKSCCPPGTEWMRETNKAVWWLQ